MKRVHLRITSPPGPTRVLHLRTFPIRIGRDPECECQLDDRFVSRLHALLDVKDGRLAVNAHESRAVPRTTKDRMELPVGEWVDLDTLGNEFFIGPIHVRAELVEVERWMRKSGLSSEDFESVDDAKTIESRTVHYEAARVDPQALDANALEDAVREALRRHRQATEALTTVLSQAASLPEERMRVMADCIVQADPQWDAESPVRLFIEKSGLGPPPSRADAVGLRWLEDLCSHYVPHAPPLDSPDAIVAFVRRIDAVLSMFIAATGALRLAYFVETCAEPPDDRWQREVAASLLDWTADRSAIDKMHAELTDLVAHHRRLVADAIESVDRTLTSLRPSDIERQVDTSWTPLRNRRLWREFVRRHDEALRQRSRPLGRTLVSVAEALGLLPPPGSACLPLLPAAPVGSRP